MSTMHVDARSWVDKEKEAAIDHTRMGDHAAAPRTIQILDIEFSGL